MTDLGLSAGWRSAYAEAVSDSGGVAVGAAQAGATQVAGIWISGGGAQPLLSYLQANGVSVPPGWDLRECYAVSADGKTFGGWARSSSGQSQGFVAVVPAPTGVLLLGMGAFAGAVRRPRARISIPA